MYGNLPYVYTIGDGKTGDLYAEPDTYGGDVVHQKEGQEQDSY